MGDCDPTFQNATQIRVESRKGGKQRSQAWSFVHEALTVFGDPLGRIENDVRHSVFEQRLVLLGVSTVGRLLVVMFAEQASETIRLISARQATRGERRVYEEAR